MSAHKCLLLPCLPSNLNEASHQYTTSGYLLCENHNGMKNPLNVVKQASEITNEQQALQFLDHFSWTIFAKFPCNKTNYHDYGYNASEETYIDNHGCLSRDLDAIFQNSPCKQDIACECSSIEATDTNEKQLNMVIFLIPMYLIFGILAIMGNLYIVINKAKYLYRKRHRSAKEKYLFNMLIVNLAAADFLMGIASILACCIGWHLIPPKNTIQEETCKLLGVITIVSNQLSISVITAISFCQLFSILFPYKSIDIKRVEIVMVSYWICWLLFACFPLFPRVETLFAIGVRNKQNGEGKPTDISFKSVIKFINFFNNSPNIDSHFRTVLEVTTKFQTPEVMRKFLGVLELIKSPSESWEFILFYKKHRRSCITVMTMIGFKEASSWFMLVVFMYVALCSTFTAIAYGILFKRMLEKQSIGNWLKSKCCATGNQTQINKLSRREAENKKLYRTIFVIVLTDLLFWLPLSIAAVVYFIFMATETACTYCKPDNFVYGFLQIFYMVFLPINSVINPIIYSKNVWKELYKWIICREQNMVEFSRATESTR